jgi:hypothetical protein
MLATAAYCVGRLLLAHRLGRRVEHEIDALHVLMGVALAGMLVPRLDPWEGGVWTGVFAATTLWLTGRAALSWRRSDPGRRTRALRHRLPHLVLTGAMLYMYLAASGSAAGSGGGAVMASGTASAARYPTAALPLALILCGYAATVVDRTPLRSATATARRAADTPATAPAGGPGGTPDPPPPDPPPLAPRGANCCDIAMSLTMALLLITLL